MFGVMTGSLAARCLALRPEAAGPKQLGSLGPAAGWAGAGDGQVPGMAAGSLLAAGGTASAPRSFAVRRVGMARAWRGRDDRGTASTRGPRGLPTARGGC